jgi:hypothetical protein
MVEREDKTLGFIFDHTQCDGCHKLGATHFDGYHFYCEVCWQQLEVDG